MNHILALLHAYRHAAQQTSLLQHDWDLLLALETRLAAATGPLTPASLQALFELHNNAASKDHNTALIKRYISLLLAYFSKLNGIDVAVLATQPTETGPSSTSYDPASKWTSLESCPTIDLQQSTYNAASLPPLSPDSSDQATWETVCGLEATRWRIREAYTRCAYQLQESQDVWKLYLGFEDALLGSNLVTRDQQLETVRHVYSPGSRSARRHR